jgi:hypothetical protein
MILKELQENDEGIFQSHAYHASNFICNIKKKSLLA